MIEGLELFMNYIPEGYELLTILAILLDFGIVTAMTLVANHICNKPW